jgi:hypothetical protein
MPPKSLGAEERKRTCSQEVYAMIRLNTITGGCLKCKHLRCKANLLESDVYCAIDYEFPHIKEPKKWVGHCDYLDYDEKTCAAWHDRLQFCRQHARERLTVI